MAVRWQRSGETVGQEEGNSWALCGDFVLLFIAMVIKAIKQIITALLMSSALRVRRAFIANSWCDDMRATV